MNGLVIPDNLNERFNEAVRLFWQTRRHQISRQEENSIHDQGNRGAVTGGKQLDGFISLIEDLLIMNGVSEKSIFVNSDLELPGYYRPNKKWDLLVVENGRLIIAVEFKSQVGPSFGNNFNNRTEEAMGSALDIWTAYREGVFGNCHAPWLGYFLLLEDCPKSTIPIKIRSPHFPVSAEFVNTSYKERYEIFCSKLLRERQYSAACFMTTGIHEEDMISFECPNPALSYQTFITSMLGEVTAYRNERRLNP